MIIEFIGSTGAGKTTLISEVRRRLIGVASVTTPFELLAEPLGLGGVTHPTVRNLIQELVGFPLFIRSLRRHHRFVAFVLRMLARQASLSIFTVNNLRSLERKLSAYEATRRHSDHEIILVDEGTVLLAHNLFVYSEAVYSDEEIAEFARLAPLPDIIVYIKAPVDVLVRRALLRADPPREIRARNQALVEKHVRRAVQMFEQLIRAESIRPRLLIVDNDDCQHETRGRAADEIADFILRSKAHQDPMELGYQPLLEGTQKTV